MNYDWEQRYTNGNLIAVHKSGQFFAYSIRLDGNGKVRVFNRRLNEKTLLKSFKGRVVDVAFAYCDTPILLGCVDEIGSLQIFQLLLDSNSKIMFVYRVPKFNIHLICIFVIIFKVPL